MTAPHYGSTCFRRKFRDKSQLSAEKLLLVVGKRNIPVTVPAIEPQADYLESHITGLEVYGSPFVPLFP